MPTYRLPTCFFILLLLLFFCPGTSPSADGESNKKTILYINSYHDGYQWSDTILEGIRTELALSRFNIELQVEYMDAKKYNITPVIESLLDLYKENSPRRISTWSSSPTTMRSISC